MTHQIERQFRKHLIRLVMTAVAIAGSSIVMSDRLAAEERVASMPENLAAASNANGQFAIDLYRQLAATESGKNVFLSPFSVSLALTMTAEGAIDQTLDQMTSVLHFPKGGLTEIHHGQRDLLKAAVLNVPPETKKKIESLRAKLKESNDQTQNLNKSKRYAEADASGSVGNALAKELNVLLSQTPAYELQIANALWIEKSFPIQPAFATALQPNYGTVLFPVDFKQHSEPVRLQINQWVAQQTNNRIQDLLAPNALTKLTKLVITNTVYFKGDWAAPFETSQTRPESFEQSADQSTQLPMMHQRNSKSASYAAYTSTGDLFPTPREVVVEMKDDDPSLYPDEQGHTMLALNYQGQKIQMVVLVPQSATGLADLEKTLTYESLQKWIEQLEHRTVDVTIPKFKLEATYQLPRALESLGMKRPFQDPTRPEGAQFEKLTTSQRAEDRLFISDVVHKTYVDVSEVGTEAAAATAVIMRAMAARIERPKTRPFVPIFKANKPFLLLIRERDTANILFLGRFVGQQP